jgi:endonuclease/exonuclease/phosphatase (EEP) superfamily protein YafD
MTGPKEKAKDFLRLRGFLWGDVVLIGVVVSAATLLGFFGTWWWLADLFSHFRVQYFLVLAVVVLLLLAGRRWKAAACFGLAAMVNLSTILPLYFGRAGPVAADGPPLRAMLLNVNRESGDAARVANAIEQFDPDFVVLEEVDAAWIRELGPSLDGYAHRRAEPRTDSFGIALWSRLPLGRAEIVHVGQSQVPSIIAEVETDHGPFTLVATHPLPPFSGRYSRLRNDQLGRLPEQVRAANSPVLLLGDLNTTPWSPHFKRLLRQSGLRDSSRGWGVQPTWPVQNPLLWIPIDHCLHSPEIQVVDRQTGPRVGSDHYPLIVDFTVQK